VAVVVAMGACGDAQSGLLVDEFDGETEPGAWSRMEPRDNDFPFEVTRDSLTLSLSGTSNQHLVRDGLLIDPTRAYVVAATFEILAPTPPGATSFCINFNQAGGEGDHSPVTTMALNLDIAGEGQQGGIIKYMGFVDGVFATIGQREVPWGEVGVEYDYRIEVNRRSDGTHEDGWVHAAIGRGAESLVDFEQDFSSFPYQVAAGEAVRVGLNSHGANWRVRAFQVGYLD